MTRFDNLRAEQGALAQRAKTLQEAIALEAAIQLTGETAIKSIEPKGDWESDDEGGSYFCAREFRITTESGQVYTVSDDFYDDKPGWEDGEDDTLTEWETEDGKYIESAYGEPRYDLYKALQREAGTEYTFTPEERERLLAL